MQLITTESQLEQACAALASHRRFYIDTEFESSRAGCRLSLVQLSVVAETTGGKPREPEIYLFDALALRSLKGLAPALGDSEVEWVVHAGLQDIDLLREALSLDDLPRLFDTQIAWGLLGPEAGVSLSYLEYRVLGLRNMKTHQADDWIRRPLPARQLDYAAADVRHLPEIETELSRRAEELGRRDIILDASRDYLIPRPESAKPLNLRSFRNAWQLEPANQVALLNLIDLFNSLAGRSRIPLPAAKSLLSIASRMPKGIEDLRRIKGVPQPFVNRHGREVIQCIQGAFDTARMNAAEALVPPAYASFDELHVEAWLNVMRSEVCARLAVSADLGLPNKLLRSMRDEVLESGNWSSCSSCLEGWRQLLLTESVAQFFERRHVLVQPGAAPTAD